MRIWTTTEHTDLQKFQYFFQVELCLGKKCALAAQASTNSGKIVRNCTMALLLERMPFSENVHSSTNRYELKLDSDCGRVKSIARLFWQRLSASGIFRKLHTESRGTKEHLDFVLDMWKHELIGNSAHGGEYRYELYMSTVEKIYLTPEQYLARERRADFKSEYFRGEVFAMAGASANHNQANDNQIVSNAILALGTQLKNSNCRVYPSDSSVTPVEGEPFCG